MQRRSRRFWHSLEWVDRIHHTLAFTVLIVLIVLTVIVGVITLLVNAVT